MKKAILIGISGCGKTTLVQRLKGEEPAYRKTQTIEHHLNFIDTPGEYLERRNFYRALIVTAADAEAIGLVQACGSEETWLPPSFALSFARPVFGIVSKADLAASEADIAFPRDALLRAGAGRVFTVSAKDGTGLQELMDSLNEGESL
jgi:ethanolamine utilization protein EutP